MAKKLTVVFLVAFCVCFLIWGAGYVKRSGLLERYAEREYLTADESAQRPAYQSLSNDEKALYTALYRGICDHSREIMLPFDADGEMFEKVYYLVEKQESELFYIDSSFYTAEKIKKAKIIYRTEDEDEISEKTRILNDKLDEIVSQIPDDSDDFEKLTFIHDYIISNCKYTAGDNDATAYGCLVEGKAVCEGYAKAFDLLAKRVGIASLVLTGMTDDGENHAWNQFELGGTWYNADITWDDNDKDGELSHVYFLCNDTSFYQNEDTPKDMHVHIADDEYIKPMKCKSADNYYVKAGLFAEDMNTAEKILCREIKRGADSAELKFSDSKTYSDFKDEFISGEKIFRLIMDNSTASGLMTITTTENKDERVIRIGFR